MISDKNNPKPISKTFFNFFSGLTGSFISVTLCHPLEIARSRLNLQNITKSKNKYKGFFHALRVIFKEEGFRGYYKGYQATALSVPTFYSLFFTIYNKMKDQMQTRFQVTGFYNHLLSSVMTGAVCDLITNPLWIIRTRMQTQYLHNELKYTSVWQSLRTIYKEEGFLSMYKGYLASMIGLSHAGIQFPVYEKCKEYYGKDKELNSLDILRASIISKMCACIITYPHIVVRTRLFDNKSRTRMRIKDLIRQTLKNEGVRGFYGGLGADLVRVIPMNSITFLIYEFMNERLQKE